MARLEHVIARNVIELRGVIGATQAQLAEKMRGRGFAWGTNRVTQVETLRRPVSLLEVVGLSYVFGVPVARLLTGEDDIDMPNGSTMRLEDVRLALAGKGKGGVTVRDATTEELDEHKARYDDLRKIAKRVGVPPKDVDAAAYRVFGQSLFAERDERAGDLSDFPTRSAQTKRGHVTRKMVEELRTHFQDGGDDG
jgi:hypothetical protein